MSHEGIMCQDEQVCCGPSKDTAVRPGRHAEKLSLLHLSAEVNWQVHGPWQPHINNLTIEKWLFVNAQLS